MSSAVQAYTSLEKTPYQKFVYALLDKETPRQYPRRLSVFRGYLQLNGTSIEIKSNVFFESIESKGIKWLENELLRFFHLQNSRVELNHTNVFVIRISKKCI